MLSVWCGKIGNYFIGSLIFENNLTEECMLIFYILHELLRGINTNYQNKNILLARRSFYKFHSTNQTKFGLNRSRDLPPLDYNLRCSFKNTVHKV